jgi:hypothetical protein
MPDDILCPTCGHSLGFHKFDYGTCEAPLGGLTSKNMCGCAVTIHTYIQNLQPKEDNVKKFWQLEERYKNCMDEVANGHAVLTSALKKIEFLELKLENVRKLLNEPASFSDWFLKGYRHEAIKMINLDEIILELEKDIIDG